MELVSSAFILISLVVGALVVGTLMFVAAALIVYTIVKFFVDMVMDWTMPADEDMGMAILDHMKGRNS